MFLRPGHADVREMGGRVWGRQWEGEGVVRKRERVRGSKVADRCFVQYVSEGRYGIPYGGERTEGYV